MFIDSHTRGAGYKPFGTATIGGGQWTPASGINLGGRCLRGSAVGMQSLALSVCPVHFSCRAVS